MRQVGVDNQRALDLAQVVFRVGQLDLRTVRQQQLALYTARIVLLRVESEQLSQRVNLQLALAEASNPRRAARPRRGRTLGSQTVTDRVHCVVELFGVARLLTKTKTVPLELPEGTTLSCLISVLAERWPILVGRVIGRDKTSLVGGCACNVNGREFVRDPGTQIRTGDNVLILPADAGG